MTVPALSNLIKGILTRAGVDNPDGDAREILTTVMGCTHVELSSMRDGEIGSDVADKAVIMAKRRSSGEPIQYIIGSWSFMGREYKVGEGVLIPRDDTEVAVVEALEHIRRVKKPVIADLCSGTGIIAVTLERELTDATVYAVEKSPEAFGYLKENIAVNSSAVIPILSDLRDCVDDFDDQSLDMIVSNPPYIRTCELSGLQKEVLFEPKMALDGGESGFDFYYLIIGLWSRKLRDGGIIVFEIGEGQFDRLSELLTENGYTYIKGHPDIQGITRAITAEKRNNK